ncbi:MAG: 1-deoxy-D-xylulose-5-phosphate reductoisomerase [Desulfobacteraceae bacterium 4572_123]|nr:MAG: 1-deoxy-D-xylulose-5-phosphate reductoisomerase [Desulfobacteraceae bacterium 4572_123]
MKNLSVMGSTGSIGRNVLEIVRMFPGDFKIRALTAKENVELLAGQILAFKPEMAVVYDADLAQALEDLLPAKTGVAILYGDEGYRQAAALESIDTVITAMVGAAGLLPTMAAIDAGKNIALANKETLVMAGELVMRRAAEQKVSILPIDSEHSAIFQCLAGNRRRDLARILLTGSGGPFLKRGKDEFDSIKPADALKHPNWRMGNKITIDSATLMNKGLEFIEARWLFDVTPEQIQVVIHPQSIVHSMVAFVDGSVIAQLGVPDMKGAIAYALSFPGRLPIGQLIPEFADIGTLGFEHPDLERFPCLKLAIEACGAGGTLPAVLNAANEVAVYAFLHNELSFVNIANVVRQTMQNHVIIEQPGLDSIVTADKWARRETAGLIKGIFNS